MLLSNNLDIIFCIIIGISIVLGLIRGGLSEILNLMVWLFSIWLMRTYGTLIVDYIPAKINILLLRNIIVFSVIFIAITIIMVMVKLIFNSLLNSVGLNGLNIILGGLFGLIRGLLIAALLIIIVNNLSLHFDSSNSRIYPLLNPIVTVIIETIPIQLNSTIQPIISKD